MANKTSPLLPSSEELLRQLGERLRLARRRRRLTATQVAERAGMSPMTLRSLEHGGSGVTMGAWLAVMQVLGVEKDIDLVASADPLGRALQDARESLPGKQSRSVREGLPEVVPEPLPGTQHKAVVQSLSPTPHPIPEKSKSPIKPARKTPGSAGAERGWIEKSGFADSGTLAGLIDPPTPLPKKKR
jgi:transcriptional regulator with XRE-family HTH domain